MRTYHLAQAQVARIVSPGDTVIDATCGNGYDTLFLAKLLRGKGFLFSYDLQKEALQKALSLVETSLTEEERSVISFIHASHETFSQPSAKLILYNLGYLPGGDKKITTLAETTVASLKAGLKIIESGGAISITCYPGHKEGEVELEAVADFLKSLPAQEWGICQEKWLNREKAPTHFLILKTL